jgi:hypothetical protein
MHAPLLADSGVEGVQPRTGGKNQHRPSIRPKFPSATSCGLDHLDDDGICCYSDVGGPDCEAGR